MLLPTWGRRGSVCFKSQRGMKLLKIIFSERAIFFAAVLFNAYLLMTVRFYPSMDGPAHLYNASLIGHMLNGEASVIETFFQFNPVVVPNWISYFIMAPLLKFMPAWMAEKILLLVYLFGTTFSFRMLILQLSPGNLNLSVFILPFTYSFLFHMGFYNYSLLFILMFLTLATWIRNRRSGMISRILALVILLTLTYFSAILTFAFTGFCLGLLQIFFVLKEASEKEGLLRISKNILKEYLVLFIAALPGIILSVSFLGSVVLSTDRGSHLNSDLIKWMEDVRCLITYDYD